MKESFEKQVISIVGKERFRQYLAMLIPVVVNEFLWSVGLGALSGIAQAAGILVGKRLGEGEYDKAYQESKKLCVRLKQNSCIATKNGIGQ